MKAGLYEWPVAIPVARLVHVRVGLASGPAWQLGSAVGDQVAWRRDGRQSS